MRDLLRPFLLDQCIRRSGWGDLTTNLTFDGRRDAERATSLIAEAWGQDKVTLEQGPRSSLVRVQRDIDRYGTWPSGWKRLPPDRAFPVLGGAG